VEIIIERLNLGIGEIVARHSDDSTVNFEIKLPKWKLIDRFSGENFLLAVLSITGDQFPLTVLSVTQMAPYPSWVMIEPGGILLFCDERLRKRESKCQK
jgi:hypothetical protein